MPARQSLPGNLTVVFLAVIIGLTGFHAGAATPSQTFLVIGTEPIAAANAISAVRDQAIANGLVTAVGLAVADRLPVNAMVERYEKLNQAIYENPDRFVRDYKVLSESRQPTRYRVLVQATVAGDRIHSELTQSGILETRDTAPAVLCFISEQSIENPFPQYWWGPNMPTAKTAAETAISETLRRQGFRIVEHGPEVQAMAVQRTAGAAEIALGDAVDLGRTLRADVVVIGRSVAESANYVGADAQSFRGSLIVRAYLTGTGEAMGSIVKTAVSAVTDPGAGSREALMHVGSRSAGELAALIASAWQEQGPGGNQFEIQLSGTRNLVNFVQFRRALTTVAGVERVQVRELRADDAAIGVSYRGETTELADAIKLQAFETFGVSITDVAPERLKVKLIPRIARTTVQ